MKAAVSSIERATLAAVPPEAVDEAGGWLLGLDAGTVGRAHSAAPLMHVMPDIAVLPEIESRYVSRGLQAVFRLPRLPCFEAMAAVLAWGGYRPVKPTLVQTATTAAVARLPAAAGDVQFAPAPDDAWGSLFLGEGFDPVDGASRLAILRRAKASVFASVRAPGRLAAVGSACFSHGWMGVHGMRTAPVFRGQGLAAGVLAAFAREAQARGVDKVFLQVEEANTAAQALYRRAGFETAWSYVYWTRA